jgi:broad specificity phosphatase PhoE
MSDSKATFLYLVRHGATDANLRRPYILQGRGIDLPLNEIGRRQATRVGELFQRLSIDAVYASPMRRARETAESVAMHHGLKVGTIEALLECDVGRWEGLDWERIRREHPEEYENFQRDPWRSPYMGGESYRDVSLRALPAAEELLQRHAGQSVVVVAHNVVNRACIAMLLGLDLVRAKEIHQANGGVNVLRRLNGKTDVVTLNSIFHLEVELHT